MKTSTGSKPESKPITKPKEGLKKISTASKLNSKNSKKDKNTGEIIKAIRIIIESLESHLDNCLEDDPLPEKCLKVIGSKRFHAKCVKEYAFVIDVLAKQIQ